MEKSNRLYVVGEIRDNANCEFTFVGYNNKHVSNYKEYLPKEHQPIELRFSDLIVKVEMGVGQKCLSSPKGKKGYLLNGEEIKLFQKDLINRLSLRNNDKVYFAISENRKVFTHINPIEENDNSISEKENNTIKKQSEFSIKKERTIVDEVVQADIRTRRGQKEFRQKLLIAYQGKCAITGCDTVAALEAAHIVPHNETQSYKAKHGILLRADIHTLFDLHLISIDSERKIVVMREECRSHYKRYEGKEISQVEKASDQPEQSVLALHYQEFKRLKT